MDIETLSVAKKYTADSVKGMGAIKGDKGDKGDKGESATINGANALTITTDKGLNGKQSGDAFTLSLDTTVINNPNLLDNSDLLINQRNVSTYSATDTETPCVDRWTIESDKEDGSFNASTKVLTNATLKQKLERPSQVAGKKVRFVVNLNGHASIKIYQVSNGSLAVLPSFATAVTGANGADGEVEVITDINEAIKDGDTVEFRIVASPSCTVRYAMVTVGEAPAFYYPPNPAIELLKCQRHMLALNPLIRYSSSRFNANEIDFLIPTPTSLRATPVIDFSNLSVKSWDGSASNTVNGFTFTIAAFANNAISVRATKSAHGLTAAYLEIVNKSKPMIISAE